MPDREVTVMRPFSTKKGVVQYEAVVVPESEIREGDERMWDPEIEEKSYVVSRSDFVKLLQGESLMYGPLKRMISIQDGPFEVVDDDSAPAKIMPPEPIEFRKEVSVVVDPDAGAGFIASDATPMRERIENVLRGFVDRVRDVFRGGPGSGHHGHEGRPGEVGGSLPSGATAISEEVLEKEAGKIGGERGGFMRTLKKLRRTLQSKTDTIENPTDPQFWYDLLKKAEDEWEHEAAAGIVENIIRFHVEEYFPGKRLYKYEEIEYEEVDELARRDMRDDLSDSWVDKEVRIFNDEVEAIVKKHFDDATKEETRAYLEMSEEDFALLSALDRWAVFDAVYEKAIAEVIAARREGGVGTELSAAKNFYPWEEPEMRGLDADQIADQIASYVPPNIAAQNARRPEGQEPYIPALTVRADDWLTSYFREHLPEPDDEDLIDVYGSLPTRTRTRLGDKVAVTGEEATFPPGKHFLIGKSGGEVVSALMATERNADKALDLLGWADYELDAWSNDVGVDYNRDIAGQTFLYVNYLASKERGQGYGTEMMMKALGIAGENGFGLAGSSTDSAAPFYEKLGAKWVRDASGEYGGLAFWTPDDVQRAYRLLQRIGAGDVFEIERAMYDGFNIFNLIDLDDPAALMDDRMKNDRERRDRRMREVFERFWDREIGEADEIVVVRGPLRRVFVEKGGEGSGHHGHKGRQGEVGGSEPGTGGGGPPKAKAKGGRGAPTPKVPTDEERAEKKEAEEGRKIKPLPEDWDVYPPKDANGNMVAFDYEPQNQQFQWNDSLESVGQLDPDAKADFLNSLPEDTREMTADQRWDFAKIALDMPAESLFAFEQALRDEPNTRTSKSGTADYRQAQMIGGVRDVIYGAATYLRAMNNASEMLASDDTRKQALGRSLISNGTRDFTFDVMGVWSWAKEDQDAFRSSWMDSEYAEETSESQQVSFQKGAEREPGAFTEDSLATRHLGPKDHPSGSGQKAHAGKRGAKRRKGEKKGGDRAEAGRGGSESASDPAKQQQDEGPEITGVTIKVGDDDIHFDSQEQYETIRALAQEQHAAGVERESELTTMMSDLAGQQGGDMSGLEFAVKSENSITRKIREKMLEDGLTEEEAAARINDVNRYTMLFNGDTYVEKVKAVQSQLSEMGFVKYDNKYKNYWKEGDDYDGYNTVMVNEATGARLELQFHTYESIAVKARSHEIYAELRTTPESQMAKRKELYAEMVALWQQDFDRPVDWEQLEGVVKVRRPA